MSGIGGRLSVAEARGVGSSVGDGAASGVGDGDGDAPLDGRVSEEPAGSEACSPATVVQPDATASTVPTISDANPRGRVLVASDIRDPRAPS